MTMMRVDVARRLMMLALGTSVASLTACANASSPPGGPPDAAPPIILGVTPVSGTTNVTPKEVVVQFDEVVSETPRGAQDLASLVFISPKSGAPRVDWSRTRISIRPQKGFLPNRVYTVEIRGGIMDLRNNVLDSATRVVFSTGGVIPETRVSGVAFDWVAGRGAANALIEAITPDSTTYQTQADSTGRFLLEHLPTGAYVLRAVLDRNNNRELDPLEPWDTSSVTVADSVARELYAFQHDTVGVRIQTIVYNDSLREITLTFDKPVPPGTRFDTTQFVLRSADSTRIPITQVQTGPERHIADSLRAVQRADSVARASRDTTAAGRARADSVERRRVADSLAQAGRDAEAARRSALRLGGRPPAPPAAPPPKMNRERPFNDVIIQLGQRLEPGTYVIQAREVPNLSGKIRSPSRAFPVVRRPPPARDSTRRDTTRRDTVRRDASRTR